MNAYVRKLRLAHDPFHDAPGGHAPRDDFFGGGERESIIAKLLDSGRGRIALHAVVGPRGSGKTRLARRLCECVRGDCKPVLLSVDLFTSAQSLLGGLLRQLDIDPPADGRRGLALLDERAIDLRRAGKSILFVIDDAHEMGSDGMKLVQRLLANRWSTIQLVLFGEEQLREMLRQFLRPRYQDRLVAHELPALNRVETAQYIHWKLARAGYKKRLPLSSQAGLDLLQQSAGVPANINALTAGLLNSDEVPAVGRLFSWRRQSDAGIDRPELRYLGWAFTLSLPLVVLLLWPVTETGPAANSAPELADSRQISLLVPVRPEPGASAAPAAARPPQTEAGAPNGAEPAGPSAFERMLLDAPTDNFTVQLLASRSEQGVADFIASSQLGEIHGYYETRRERRPWFVVVYGMYPDWETAMAARARLAGAHGALEPWIRRISNVRAEINRAR